MTESLLRLEEVSPPNQIGGDGRSKPVEVDALQASVVPKFGEPVAESTGGQAPIMVQVPGKQPVTETALAGCSSVTRCAPQRRARTASPPMTANSALGADSVRAASDATRLPIPGPSSRSSPDTCELLRIPTIEDFVTARPVLGEVEGYDELVRHRVPVPMSRRLPGEAIPGRAYRHFGPCPP